jgi:hypothetical protein
MCTQPVVLDSTLRSSEAVEFGEALRAKIAGQAGDGGPVPSLLCRLELARA